MDKFKELNIRSCRPGWQTKQTRADRRTSGGAGFGSSNPFAALAQPTSGEASSGDEKSSLKKAVEALGGGTPFRRVAISECVAHIECHVEEMLEGVIDDKHWLVKGQMDMVWARASHWCGKNFRPRHSHAGDLLTFFGSQKFGYVGVAKTDVSKKSPASKKEPAKIVAQSAEET